MDMQYNYTAGQNNGRIVSSQDYISGETVQYAYDSLLRLASAQTTGTQWGEAYTYDGFGNLTGKTPTKGSAPALSVSYNPATNQPYNGNYDANGNAPVGTWNVENKLVGQVLDGTQVNWSYDPFGERALRNTTSGSWWSLSNPLDNHWSFYLYGPTGQRMAQIGCDTISGQQIGGSSWCVSEGTDVYFGGKLIAETDASGQVLAPTDRLGTVRGVNTNGTIAQPTYFPYGEPKTAGGIDRQQQFGTYVRDSTPSAQDYAMQRYYSNNTGRFFSADPTLNNVDYSNPLTWNAYSYANGDPINGTDPSGLATCGDLEVEGGGTLSSFFNTSSNAGLLTEFVWAEGGTLSENGGSQAALAYSQEIIAQAVENRLAVANGQAAVLGADGNVYWGNGGTFGGTATLAASILGYGGVGTTLPQEIVRAAGGTNEINPSGQLNDMSGITSTMSQNQSGGTIPVTLVGGSTMYVTPECDRAISAMQATNTILAGYTVNQAGFFPTSWKANGNSNPDPTRLYNLGSVGGTTFYGMGAYEYAQYNYFARRPPPPGRGRRPL
jgi:RHS repeat-associated protein